MEMHQRCAMVMVARDGIEPPTLAFSGLLPMELTGPESIIIKRNPTSCH